MKKIIFILFIITSSNVFSQEIKLDKKYFLLGTLDDYIGRNQISNNKELIESYGLHEKPLVDVIHILFKEKELSLNSIKKRYFFKGKSLNDSINSFYTFDSFQLTHPKKDTIYKGKLRTDIFKTREEKISFLLGCLARYSRNVGIELKEKEFCIQYSNSRNKFEITSYIIEELGFSINKTETLNNIPRQNIIYFTVNDANYELFKTYNLLGIEVQNNLLNYYSKSIKK